MNRLLSRLLFLFALTIMETTMASGSGDSPEVRAKAFYTWFIQHDTDRSYPLQLQGIEQYVSKDIVTRLRDDYAHAGPPGGVDYFLKVQDYDTNDWLAHMAIHPAIALGEVVVVPITFGLKSPTSVLVFMRKIDGVWKITKISDTWDYR